MGPVIWIVLLLTSVSMKWEGVDKLLKPKKYFFKVAMNTAFILPWNIYNTNKMLLIKETLLQSNYTAAH